MDLAIDMLCEACWKHCALFNITLCTLYSKTQVLIEANFILHTWNFTYKISCKGLWNKISDRSSVTTDLKSCFFPGIDCVTMKTNELNICSSLAILIILIFRGLITAFYEHMKFYKVLQNANKLFPENAKIYRKPIIAVEEVKCSNIEFKLV